MGIVKYFSLRSILSLLGYSLPVVLLLNSADVHAQFQHEVCLYDYHNNNCNSFSQNFCSPSEIFCQEEYNISSNFNIPGATSVDSIRFDLYYVCGYTTWDFLLNNTYIGSANGVEDCDCQASNTQFPTTVTFGGIDSLFNFGGNNTLTVIPQGFYWCVQGIQATVDYTINPTDTVDVALGALIDHPYACTSSLQDLTVRLVNFGIDSLSSANINWSISQVPQPTFSWSGALPSLGYEDVTLGQYIFDEPQAYELRFWASEPNGKNDPNPGNDSLAFREFYCPLSGDYTIGPNQADFETFGEAINTLTAKGVSGPVNFYVQDGTYPEQLLINPFPGNSTRNPVRFESLNGDSTAVILTHAPTASHLNYVVKLHQVVGIDFSKITIQNTHTSYGRVIHLSDADSCQFYHNILEGISATGYDDEYAVVYSRGPLYTYSEENTFIGNRILKGSYGFFESGTTFKHNQLIGQHHAGIYPTILGQPVISHNTIILDTITTQAKGIVFYGSTVRSPVIENNYIYLPSGGHGIYFNNFNNSINDTGRVVNNMVIVEGAPAKTGIYFGNTSDFDIYFNNVLISGTDPGSKAIDLQSVSGFNIRNNNFVNMGDGLALNQSGSSPNTGFNNYYSSGSSLISWGNQLLDLPGLRQMHPGDSSSVSVDPQYVSTTDLHVGATALNLAGTSIPGITQDFDGDKRYTVAPDIGADEFYPYPTDAGISGLISPATPFPEGSNDLIIALNNEGTADLTSVDLVWEQNGVIRDTVSWAGDLATGDSAHVNLGTLVLNIGDTGNIRIWTRLPNHTIDQEPANDTLIKNNLLPSLSGSYTIGGVMPDFVSFSAAVAALEGGVSGAVTFEVRDGIYQEQILINAINGASCQNPVIFQSQSRDSSKVTLEYDAVSWADDYTIRLDGADGISFRHMTIKALDASYGTVVIIHNGADCNTFLNNEMETNASTMIVSVSNHPVASTNNVFKHNLFLNGNYGIYFRGSDKYGHIFIENNRFIDQYWRGLSLEYLHGISVRSNYFRTNSTNSSHRSILTWHCDHQVEISGNTMMLNNSSANIRIKDCKAYSSVPNDFVVSNNFIQNSGSNADGIECRSSDYIKFYNNTIHINGTNTNTRTIGIYSARLITLTNNILANTAGGYALYISGGSSPVRSSDHNDLFATGSSLVYWNGDHASLADWQAYRGHDLNSVSADPNFAGPEDLHAASFELDAAALPLNDITVDIDREPRDPVNPDIGADEFDIFGLDVGIKDIPINAEAGLNNVVVSLVNHGTVPLTAVQIDWEVNGVAQFPFHWTGNLDRKDSTHINIGSYFFDYGAVYRIKAWTVQPNGQQDLEAANDTAVLDDISVPLAGTYTIGGSGSDFSSLTHAINALNFGGIKARVTFNINDGTYTEQVSLEDFPGNSCDSTVIIQSASLDSSKVTISHKASSDNDNFVIQVNGAEGILIRHLTLEATDTIYARVVNINTGSNCLELSNNCLKSTPRLQTSSGKGNIVNSVNSSENVFKNNRLKDGDRGFYLYSNGSGLVVENNIIEGPFYDGMRLDWQGGFFIRNNIITDSAQQLFSGIRLENCNNGFDIEGNWIKLQQGGRGIYMKKANKVYTNVYRGLIANNFISIGGNGLAYGMYTESTYNLEIYHNNIHVYSNAVSQSIALLNYSAGMDLRNNVLANTGGGYVIYEGWSNSNIGISDYNDLYSNGSNLAYYNGYYPDLSAWQSGTGYDPNSVSVNPLFHNNLDLHVKSNQLDQSGTPLSAVPLDFDGETRNSLNPDIGADEFIPPASIDAGVTFIYTPSIPVTPDTHDIQVRVKNFGTTAITQLSVDWTINNIPQPRFEWTGNLATSDTMVLPIGELVLSGINSYDIKAWILQPNGVADTLNSNDTSEVFNIIAALDGPYTIGGSNPDFNSVAEAVTYLNTAGVLGDVDFLIREGFYDDQIRIKQFAGSSCQTLVTFRPDPSNTAPVAIRHYTPISSGERYTLQLDGADGIIFRDLTLVALNPGRGRITDIRNGAHCNQFIGNIFDGAESLQSAGSGELIYSPGTRDMDNIIKNNQFNDGHYGILFDGAPGCTGTVIDNNVFTDQYYGAISVEEQVSVHIRSNHITTETIDYYTAIHLKDCDDSIRIADNSIIATTANGKGIRLESCQGAPAKPGMIVNNMAAIGTNPQAWYGSYYHYSAFGIWIDESAYQECYFNNVNMVDATAGSGAAFLVKEGTNITWANNIWVNSSGSLAARIIPGTNANYSGDHNCLYTSGQVLAYDGTASYNDLSGWQSATGFDANSILLYPFFYAPDDLHIYKDDLKGIGTPISGITHDFDGDPRDPDHPDIGADEFTPILTYDAGVTFIHTPVIPITPDTNDLYVTLKNFGTEAITQLSIDWTINNTPQPRVNWTGNMGTFDSVMIPLGSLVPGGLTRYAITAWTFRPNGRNDSLNNNDTAKALNLLAGLEGPYTIGGSSPDFTNLNQAVTHLHDAGILGDVDFFIREGTYDEQIRIAEIAGSSCDNRITFQPDPSNTFPVAIRHYVGLRSPRKYTIQLDGADGITFKDLTIVALNPGRGRIMDIRNGAHCNRVLNNKFEGVESILSSGSGELLYSPGTTDTANIISHNHFNKGYYGIMFDGGANCTGTRIEGNRFTNQYSGAIALEEQVAVKVIANTITTATTNYYTGIHLDNCHDSIAVSKNKIVAGQANGKGIWLEQCMGTTNHPGKVINNMASIGTNSQTWYGSFYNYSTFGIRIDGSQHQQCYFNNVNMVYSPTASGAAFLVKDGSGITWANNIWANFNGTHATMVHPGANSTYSADYNCLYTTGANLAQYGSNHYPDLAGWQSAVTLDANTLSIDPLYFEPDDLHVYEIALEGKGTPIAGISDDIDGEQRNTTTPDIGADEFTPTTNNVGVCAILDPQSGCDLGDSVTVRIKIRNFGSAAQTNFNVAYTLDNGPATIENVDTLVIPGGATLTYTFRTKAEFTGFRTYAFNAYTLLTGDEDPANDTLPAIYEVEHAGPLPMVSNLLPADSTADLPVTVNFSWNPVTNAKHYDLFLWLMGQPKPATPVMQNSSDINFAYSNLDYGQWYQWQLIAKNGLCDDEEYPVMHFKTRDLPDLVVDSVIVPLTTFSNQPMNLEWVIRNDGIGSTPSNLWYDGVWLSTDTILVETIDFFLGSVNRLNTLDAGESYRQQTSLMIPRGMSGDFYVIVKTNYSGSILEANDGNNAAVSIGTVEVQLTPPPDLQVVTVIAPPNVFSGQPFNVSYTVENRGTGDTKASVWVDKIYLSDLPYFDEYAATEVDRIVRYGILEKDSSYTLNRSVSSDINIYGNHFIYVKTDVRNHVYEHAAEGNNFNNSDTVDITLTPPPDLVVDSNTILLPDTLEANGVMPVIFHVNNAGPGTPYWTNGYPPGWNDRVYLSSSPVFDNTATLVFSDHRTDGNFVPGASYDYNRSATVPVYLSGTYYAYYVTDHYDYVFEFNGEANNIYRSPQTVEIVNPDLTIVSVQATDPISSGNPATIDYTVQNQGLAKAHGSWKDRIYISTAPAFHPDSVMVLGEFTHAGGLVAGSSYSNVVNVTLPNGVYGDYYFFVKTDAKGNVNEAALENNNTGRSNQHRILLSPWADLMVTAVHAPDSATAGAITLLSWDVLNQGMAAADPVPWIDNVYISPTVLFDENTAIPLGTKGHFQTLDKDSGYQADLAVTIPGNLAQGTYYFLVNVNHDRVVYEHSDTSNNIGVSASFYLNPYPPVNLTVTQIHLPDTVYSGDPVHVDYMVMNTGQAATLAPQFRDFFYLSPDNNLDRFQDDFVGQKVHTQTLPSSDQYQVSFSFQVPNGLSGQQYIIVHADAWDQTLDVNLADNIKAEPVYVKLRTPSDLIVTSVTAPAAQLSGQHMNVDWIVANTGTGNTRKSSWNDGIYLSSDNVLDGSDHKLGYKRRNGNLSPGSNYQNGMSVFIPTWANGNYYIIVKADNSNEEYEHQAEGNNTQVVNIDIHTPLPSDLVITGIQHPDTVTSGEIAGFGWTTVNQGLNTATGQIAEAIYISPDTTWDINDPLIASTNRNLSLGPGGQSSFIIGGNIPGVAPGPYYLLVRTDLQNVFPEDQEGNNTGVSIGQVHVQVPELVIDIPFPDTVEHQGSRFYRVEIDDSTEIGEALLVSLTGDSLNGRNELYMSLNVLPSRSDHQFSANALQGNQEIFIPVTQAGTYYVMVYGERQQGPDQPVSVLAEILEFEIRSIEPEVGGDIGSVTVELRGSKLDSMHTYLLTNDSTTITGSYYAIVDHSQVFATFDLLGQPQGLYDVKAINAVGDTAVLYRSFQIVPGQPAKLELSLVTPARTIPSNIEKVFVGYTNTGNVDLVSPEILFNSIGGAVIDFDVENLLEPGEVYVENIQLQTGSRDGSGNVWFFFEDLIIQSTSTSMVITVSELGGPAGILRPKVSGTYTVYCRVNGLMSFSVEKYTNQ